MYCPSDALPSLLSASPVSTTSCCRAIMRGFRGPVFDMVIPGRRQSLDRAIYMADEGKVRKR